MRRSLLAIGAVGALVAGLFLSFPAGATTAQPTSSKLPASKTHELIGDQHWCNTNGYWCAEPYQNWVEFPWFKDKSKRIEFYPYIGHDEPSMTFYSNTPGSGYDSTYTLRLPKEPPTQPKQDGSGGAYNFELRPAFWLGMDLCDDQSAPNPDGQNQDGHATIPCTPDSDTNIYSSTDPNSDHYFGLQPGGAFLELQWYPPGWNALPAGLSCDRTKWCSALTIDEFSSNSNTGAANNDDCLNRASIEPQLFAYVTKDGKSTSPGNALNPNRYNLDPSKVFFQGPGDTIKVHIYDTTDGLKTTIDDLTTGTSGSMTASVANGFGQIKFDPGASTCSLVNEPFHPQFATSTTDTRLMWTAHTYNVAYSDEIGHWTFCGNINDNGICTRPLGADTNNGDKPSKENPNGDDQFCEAGDPSALIKIHGCLASDSDFDGASYLFDWPGSTTNREVNSLLAPEPLMFSSATFAGGQQYAQVGFESNLSRIEDAGSVGDNIRVPCQRHIANPGDKNPGKGCVKPPPGSSFYPFFSTTTLNGRCVWQEGGGHLPNTISTYNGIKQFGPLLDVRYPTVPYGVVTERYNDFRNILPNNPCKA